MTYQGAYIFYKDIIIAHPYNNQTFWKNEDLFGKLIITFIAIKNYYFCFDVSFLFLWYPFIFYFLFDFLHWHLPSWFFSNWIEYYSRQPKTRRFFLWWFVAEKVFFDFKILSIIDWLFIKFFSYDVVYLIPNRFIFF